MAVATSFELPPGSPTGVVDAALDMLDELDQVLWSAKTPDELLGANVALEAVRSRVAAVQARVAAEIDAADAAKVEGWASVPDYLTATSGGRQGWGNRLLRTARAMTSDRHATHSALHRGGRLPRARRGDRQGDQPAPRPHRPARRGRAVPARRGQPPQRHRPPGQPATTCSRSSTPTAWPAARNATSTRTNAPPTSTGPSSIIDDGLGGVKLRGRGTVEDAAVIRAALAALSAPLPNTDPEDGVEGRDPRDHGARTWDALVETCQKALDADTLPESHGAKPRVMVLIDHDALRFRSRHRHARHRPTHLRHRGPQARLRRRDHLRRARRRRTTSSTSAAPTDWSPSGSGSP